MDDKEKNIQLFRTFLKENNALESYIHNFRINRKDSYFFWHKEKDHSQFILAAFGWRGTPQGHDYWERLHNKWLMCLPS